MNDTTTPINPHDPSLVGKEIVCTYGNGDVERGVIIGCEVAEHYDGETIPFLLANFGGPSAGRIPIRDLTLPAHMAIPYLDASL